MNNIVYHFSLHLMLKKITVQNYWFKIAPIKVKMEMNLILCPGNCAGDIT